MDAAAGEFARRPVAAPRPARGLAPVLGLALGLALLGNENVSVYDGSWSEWGLSDAPIESSD